MGPLVLAKNFLMVAHSGQSFRGDWRRMDSEFQYATVHVHCQTIVPSGAATGFQVNVESSFDTVENYQLSTLPVSGTGSYNAAISSNIGPLVRLHIRNPEAFAMVAIVSVWLQTKSE